ncbi:hypothetical protein SLEP1_g14751 [Rubroshorea leprosula]|uniref:Uncharacterized protein n=1 Tax=Rubroshorea leprosula TaxID=152421 RepID=A0AAV5IK69_9ROSI|nr:hypothetical protein SLEP1_g14751 [Rubroshorea leprosula]
MKLEGNAVMISIGLTVGAPLPLKLPGSYPGSIGFNSNGIKLVFGLEKEDWGKSKKVIEASNAEADLEEAGETALQGGGGESKYVGGGFEGIEVVKRKMRLQKIRMRMEVRRKMDLVRMLNSKEIGNEKEREKERAGLGA